MTETERERQERILLRIVWGTMAFVYLGMIYITYLWAQIAGPKFAWTAFILSNVLSFGIVFGPAVVRRTWKKWMRQ